MGASDIERDREILLAVFAEAKRREGLAFASVTYSSNGIQSRFPCVDMRALPLKGFRAKFLKQTLSGSISILDGELRATGTVVGDLGNNWWVIKTLPITADVEGDAVKIVNWVEGDFRRRGA